MIIVFLHWSLHLQTVLAP